MSTSTLPDVLKWDVPPAWQLVPFQTVTEILLEAATRRPGAQAMIFEDGLVVTVGELLELVESFAGYLRERVRPQVPMETRREQELAPSF